VTPPSTDDTPTDANPRVFATAMDDDSCKHLLSAAWGWTSYLGLLQPPLVTVTIIKGVNMSASVEANPMPRATVLCKTGLTFCTSDVCRRPLLV
jgi:hypothetical protein